MHLRFYIDPETDLPHIYAHNVDEQEVYDCILNQYEDIKGKKPMRILIGTTEGGRWLRVVYKPEKAGYFVITAYDLPLKQKKSLSRRIRNN
jgi:hypothetical protein